MQEYRAPQEAKRLHGTRKAFITVLLMSFLCYANTPRNIVLMIADGCGFQHVQVTDYYQYGESGRQIYQDFPVRMAMSTYPIDGSYHADSAWHSFQHVRRKPTDSAASATALATGHKTYNGRICMDSTNQRLENIVDRAEASGKSTGVVTSVPISHATPAGFVAHNLSRHSYPEIATEMITGSAVDVIMGCGHPMYTDDGRFTFPFANKYRYVGGRKLWRSLRAGSAGKDADGDGVADRWTLIQSREQFVSLAVGETPKRLIGIPQVHNTLQQKRQGAYEKMPYQVPYIKNIPTLPEMTAAAINVLDENPRGFFLMIEGGAIDWAGHANQSARLIEEMIDFNRAVETVVKWVEQHSSWDETLLIITADHETGYLNGPGSGPSNATCRAGGKDCWKPIGNRGAGNVPDLRWYSRQHTNSLVPLYAIGCRANELTQIAEDTDPRRGPYVDNSQIGRFILDVMQP